MPQPCTVCAHPQRPAIEADLMAGISHRTVASRYGVGFGSVFRHWRNGHVTSRIAAAATRLQRVDAAEGSSLLSQLHGVLAQLRRFLAAADAELRDPTDPTRYYLGPRAEDVEVVYTRDDGMGHAVRAKARLSALITQAEQGGISAYEVNVKGADLRDLLIKAADSMGRQLRVLGEVEGLIADKVQVQVNVLQYMPRVVAVLSRFPAALDALRHELGQGIAQAAPLEALPSAQASEQAGGAPSAQAEGGRRGGPRAPLPTPEGGCSGGDTGTGEEGGPQDVHTTDTTPPLLKGSPPLEGDLEGVSTK